MQKKKSKRNISLYSYDGCFFPSPYPTRHLYTLSLLLFLSHTDTPCSSTCPRSGGFSYPSPKHADTLPFSLLTPTSLPMAPWAPAASPWWPNVPWWSPPHLFHLVAPCPGSMVGLQLFPAMTPFPAARSTPSLAHLPAASTPWLPLSRRHPHGRAQP